MSAPAPQSGPTPNLADLLHSTFGFRDFRASQQAVCEAAVAGRDVLLVMPTGAGKSLCYQLPALARTGTALVISPLIALMDDQANKLTALGLNVGRIHSGLDREHSRQVCRDYLDGKLQFLFIAPERFRVPGFGAMLAKRRLALIAIDEAHCISQWGHDFRPDYRNLAAHLQALRPAPVIALTATATPQVQRDIVTELALQNPAQFIQGFRRTNLAVEVVEVSKPRRTELAQKLLSDPANRPAIIYAPSRKDAEALTTELNQHFPTATYHAGLAPDTRERVQREFLTGKKDVIVATIAFGMGIDKADVRTVLHMAMPASVESYYQEIGRAGRDGKPARTVLMYSFADRRMHDFFLERDYPPTDTLSRIAAALGDQPIHADDLRIRLKLDLDIFGPALDKLLAQGAAQIDFGGNVTRAENAPASWRRNYDVQVNFRRGQIDAIMRFASSAECRMAALIRHFGDSSDSARACGLCDFCSPERAFAQSFRNPTRDETHEMERILRSLNATPNGKSTGKLYTELHPRGDVDRKVTDTLLDALTRAGYVAIESASFVAEDGREISYRRASLTHEGREAAAGEPLAGIQMRGDDEATAPSKSRSSSKRKPREGDETPLNADQKQLDAALRAWRAEEAKQLKKPAFVVFGDRTLRQIALDAPQTLAELQTISGIGAAKAERWGAAILAVITGDTTPQNADAKTAPATAKNTPQRTSNSTVQRTISYLQPRETRPETPQIQPQSLEFALKVWRMREAQRLETAPFDLLHDRVIHEIAAGKPRSVDALLAIPGIKPAWAQQYGEAVCSVVAQHA
jgi:ATP-dependent DNA helicase RecQ